jgi:translation initiation factor IF-3
MDYGKWRYEAQKKEKVAKKKQTVISIKEIQLRPRTDQHDLDVKLKHARKFLLHGDKVKMNLLFRGREMAHQELGVKMLNEAANTLEDISNVEDPPKKEGRQWLQMPLKSRITRLSRRPNLPKQLKNKLLSKDSSMQRKSLHPAFR